MRASDLQGKPVRDEAGHRLGRVDELHIRDGIITALVCGPVGLLQRFTASRAGRRVPWTDVVSITHDAIVVATPRVRSRPSKRRP